MSRWNFLLKRKPDDCFGIGALKVTVSKIEFRAREKEKKCLRLIQKILEEARKIEAQKQQALPTACVLVVCTSVAPRGGGGGALDVSSLEFPGTIVVVGAGGVISTSRASPPVPQEAGKVNALPTTTAAAAPPPTQQQKPTTTVLHAAHEGSTRIEGE